MNKWDNWSVAFLLALSHVIPFFSTYGIQISISNMRFYEG